MFQELNYLWESVNFIPSICTEAPILDPKAWKIITDGKL
jgi:hypothetical protein